MKLLLAGAEALDRCRTTREQGKELRRLALLYAERGMIVRSSTGTLGTVYSVGPGEDPWINIEWASAASDSVLRLSECDFITKGKESAV